MFLEVRKLVIYQLVGFERYRSERLLCACYRLMRPSFFMCRVSANREMPRERGLLFGATRLRQGFLYQGALDFSS